MPWRTVMLFSAPSPGCCPFGGATSGGAVAVVSQKWLPLPSSDDLRVCRYCVVDWIGICTSVIAVSGAVSTVLSMRPVVSKPAHQSFWPTGVVLLRM